MKEIKEFVIDRDDYLTVISTESLTEVQFFHTDQHGFPILVGDITVTLREIVQACRHGTAKQLKRPVFWIRYVEYIDYPHEDGYEIKRVICTYPRIYKRWVDATNKATDLNDRDRMNRSWIEKFLSRFRKAKIGWIVSAVEWE